MFSDDYEAICSKVPEFKEFPIEEYTWAIMMVTSRTLEITIEETKTSCFVPLVDMANHRRPR